MLNKNDPLIAAVQKVMETNQAERNAVAAVNEKFGVTDRKALPRERQREWDSAYQSILTEGLHPNQQKLDVHEPEKDELTKHDFRMLRARKKPMEEAKKMKGDDPCWDNYEMIGMKKGKGGKEVPNCVPVKEQDYSATQPSTMGLKPDYAKPGTTPDYAQPTTQTVNRAAKTSMPAGTVKEAMMNKIMKKLEEKKMTSAEMKKEKEIKKKVDSSGMKASMKKQYGSEKGKSIYFATIRKKAMKAAE